MKKLLTLLALFLLLSLSGCGQDTEASAPTEPESIPHSLSVHSQGGLPLKDIQVLIYEGAGIVAFGETDENGCFCAQLPAGGDYAIELSDIPRGYRCQERYAFDGASAQILLTSSLITDESLSNVSLGVGDVMVDFTVTTPTGEQITLSQVLAEKDAVLLNFWYSSCGPCANEFPYIQAAYEAYGDKAAILALDPLEDDTAVRNFQGSMGLTFPMAACPAAWSNTFSLSGYPTSIVIDRYGVICLMEAGSITSQRPFTKIFEHFTAADYQQTLFSSLSELVTAEKPNVSMPESQQIAAVLSPTLEAVYRPETNDDAEYAWPFVLAEKLGQPCIKASNQEVDASFAILYTDIYLQAGQALAFDYLSSSEPGCDMLYVLVDGEDVRMISGYNQEEVWETCYPWVASESRSYEIALCYWKDSDTSEGDDTVYLKNMRIVDQEQIDAPTYVPRLAATETDSGWEYVTTVFNEEDGYYHVNTADGPLLLVELMNYTQFNEESTLWELAYNGILTRDGENVYDEYVSFFSYASNSQLSGVSPVTLQLEELLQLADLCCGFDNDDPAEWLQACKYYDAYGTQVQLSDPIAGLATFSAFEARLGKNLDANCFYYDRPIMPRGLLARFTPTKTGVYRITSHSDSPHGVEAWIFAEDRSDPYTYEADLRIGTDNANVNMVYFMEAGKDYYIDIAFWDIYEVGCIPYDITYEGPTYDAFRLASPGYFTYDANATGEHMYDIIAGGIDVVLGQDGIYYHDLGNGVQGSKLYADFTGITGLFSQPLVGSGDIKGIIELGGFDFSRTELDMEILSYLQERDGDQAATREYLKTLWGEDFDLYAEEYRIEDVFNGIYHGQGTDCTDDIQTYVDRILTSGPQERRGCVVVDEELARLLQLLVDKYTFAGVEHSWTKLCYYYDYMGR